MRDLDPTTPGQDLEHYSTLAESTGISLGAKEVVTEADMKSTAKKATKDSLKKSGMKTEASKPDFLDMDKDGDKKEPMKKAAKDAKKKKEPVKEAEKTKYSLDDLKKQRDKLASRTKELEKLGKDDKKKKEVKEGGVGNLKIEMEDDAAQMSKQEFIKTHGEKYAHIWDRVQGQMKGDPKYDESRVNEAEQVIKAEKKQKLPSKKSILMMCGKGMSKSAICKEYSDCDQEKLKEMVEACMEEYKKKKNESVTFEDMDGEIVEAQSAKQKAAFKKMLDKKKGKTSDDKEMDEGAYGKKKKKTVKESVEPKMSFVEMMKLVRESGGQQAIDPMDDVLWSWANRVAKSKVEESTKQEIFAAMVYERNGGRFEMYDVVEKGLNEGKDCNCGPDCACKGNCGDDCNCGPDCGK